MVKIVLRMMNREETCEFEELNKGMLALLQLVTMLASVSKGTVIAFMDEASWKKIEEKPK